MFITNVCQPFLATNIFNALSLQNKPNEMLFFGVFLAKQMFSNFICVDFEQFTNQHICTSIRFHCVLWSIQNIWLVVGNLGRYVINLNGKSEGIITVDNYFKGYCFLCTLFILLWKGGSYKRFTYLRGIHFLQAIQGGSNFWWILEVKSPPPNRNSEPSLSALS